MKEILDCGHVNTIDTSKPRYCGGTGYGIAPDGKRICYACCAEVEKESMRKTGQAVLYLSETVPGLGKVTDWPGILSIPCGIRKGKHNIAGTRYGVHFCFEGDQWWGVQYGDNTQICRCRRIK